MVKLSLEIFPPKKQANIESVYNTIDALSFLNPEFISVTYGAGGSIRNNKTCELASLITNKYKIKSLAHLTCINSTISDIDSIITDLKAHGINSILALRGDRVDDFNLKPQYRYSYELVKHLKEKGNFEIFGACYPEGHIECESFDKDIENLKYKIDAGVSELISQLFFDNELYFKFLEKLKCANINIPIHAGIMPVINATQLIKMTTMCGASIPKKLGLIVNKYCDNHEDLEKAGIEYSINQIIDLNKNGVSDIHLYTMNNPKIAKIIDKGVR